MNEPIVLVRVVHFAATVLAAGTIGFLVLIAEPAARHRPGLAMLNRRCRFMLWTALAVAVISGAIWLLLLASAIAGEPLAQVWRDGTLWTVASQTRFGQVCGLRLALAILLGVLALYAEAPGARFVSLALAAAFAALLAMVGHGGATPGAAGLVFLVVDMGHLMAASAWVGALPGLVLLLAMAAHVDDAVWRGIAVRAAHRFSILGIVCVGALLVTGAVNSWHMLNGADALLTTAYGRLLVVKIVLFAVMVGIASVNRFGLTPRLPAAATMRALLRNSVIEIVLGFGILAIVGALGTMAPMQHTHDMEHRHASMVVPATIGERPQDNHKL
jgi:copper resistance protein D